MWMKNGYHLNEASFKTVTVYQLPWATSNSANRNDTIYRYPFKAVRKCFRCSPTDIVDDRKALMD